MTRAPFQVLVLTFRRLRSDTIEFGCLRRADDDRWQGVAGGGERDETPDDTAVRETVEELGVPPSAPFYRLTTTCSIPAFYFRERRNWPRGVFVIPEHSFAVDCTSLRVCLSHEHVSVAWGTYEETRDKLSWDSNKTALWELTERLRTNMLIQIPQRR